MSDEEEVMSGEETEEEDEEETKMAPPEDEGPTEAELAMQKRREGQQMSSSGLDDQAKDLLHENERLRETMAEEIEELRARSEQRKKERQEEERELTLRRQEEDVRRKTEEEERKAKKLEEEKERRAKRDAQMAEFAKFASDGKPNFVINKKEGGGLPQTEEVVEEKNYMSREQLEQERKAILGQRIQPLEIDGLDSAKLADKCKSWHKDILRLESEKYDLEKRFKEQQYDMMEMSERARQINQVGKTGLKRLAPDEEDVIAQKYSGAPGKIEMYSKFERQSDKRSYGQKHDCFMGPTYLHPVDRLQPSRGVAWDPDTGIPLYTGGAPPAPEPVAAEAPAEEEE